ncbi:MAG: OmpA family protein [Gemmatimonadales bacterium]
MTGESAGELETLRELLLGAERDRIDALDARVAAQALTPEQLAEQLPEAIALRARTDRQLALALAPTVENAIGESVRRRPGDFAAAIFPVLGPAIRKAIAETMAELVGSINRAMEHSFSVRGLKWRIESWRTGVPYAQVVLRHALVYRVEQVFLVHTGTGLLLAKASPPDLAVPDADLVSAMLTAIRDFVADSFRQETAAGGLRTFSVGELNVMVEPGPHALLAAVVRGQPAESFRLKAQETIEGVHAQFSSALAEFDGDSAPFEAVQPLLQDCLVTVLETDAPPGAAVNWRPVVIGAVLLLAIGVTWYEVSAARWRRVLAALAATPGLTVIDARRGWGSLTIHGLRDPDAALPNARIASVGGDTGAIRHVWEPYLSLAPDVVVARAARVLGGTSDVHYALRGDTLVVGGHAPLDWVTGVANRRGLPAGVSAIDVATINLDTPAGLQPLVDEIAGSRVLFDVGSAAPGAPGGTSLGTIATRLARLHARARDLGSDVQLDLFGRTDATGTDDANAALSRQRVEAVRDALSPAAARVALVTHPLGTTQPLAAADSATRARANRSVSFGVRFLLRPATGTRPQ